MLSRPRMGSGSTVGRLSKWSLTDLAASPAPSTTGVTIPAASSPAATVSETMQSSLRGPLRAGGDRADRIRQNRPRRNRKPGAQAGRMSVMVIMAKGYPALLGAA